MRTDIHKTWISLYGHLLLTDIHSGMSLHWYPCLDINVDISDCMDNWRLTSKYHGYPCRYPWIFGNPCMDLLWILGPGFLERFLDGTRFGKGRLLTLCCREFVKFCSRILFWKRWVLAGSLYWNTRGSNYDRQTFWMRNISDGTLLRWDRLNDEATPHH